jgi:hypothetical protein
MRTAVQGVAALREALAHQLLDGGASAHSFTRRGHEDRIVCVRLHRRRGIAALHRDEPVGIRLRNRLARCARHVRPFRGDPNQNRYDDSRRENRFP